MIGDYQPIRYKGTLYKVESNHNRVRTNEMEGFFFDLPFPGQCFQIFGQSLELKDPEAKRIIRTSLVQSVTLVEKDFVELKTLNSTYRLRWSLDERITIQTLP
jgi:hypothetical protein